MLKPYITMEQFFFKEQFKARMALGKLNKKIDSYIDRKKAIPKKYLKMHRELVAELKSI